MAGELSTARSAFEAFTQGLETGEWGAFLDHLSDDFRFWFPAGAFKGENVGKERAAAFLSQVSQVFAGGLQLEVQRVTATGPTVVFECRSIGYMLGRPYENQAAISFDIREGKVYGYREYLGAVYQLS